jgi:SAM-dependent methyltransferase
MHITDKAQTATKSRRRKLLLQYNNKAIPMLKYVAIAGALKAASLTPRLYRKVANRFGDRVNSKYGRIRCAELQVDWHKDRVKPGDHILDLGTGWMNFFAIYLTGKFDVKVTAFDVIDNREFAETQEYFRIHRNLPNADVVIGAKSFEDIYKALGITYVVADSLAQFPDNEFQTVFSVATLEHVPRAVIREQIEDTHRILKPGGYAIHKIDMTDHLAHYDGSASKREFLRWGSLWPLFFQNDVQYVNRLLAHEYKAMFERAGFVLEYEERAKKEMNGLNVAECFQHLPREELETSGLTVIYRK